MLLLFAHAGRYLAGSFLSEENKIMIELKQAAEKRCTQQNPKQQQHQQQQHGNAPFSWLFLHMRRDW